MTCAIEVICTPIFQNTEHQAEWLIYILVKLRRTYNSNCLRKQLLIWPVCMLIYTW